MVILIASISIMLSNFLVELISQRKRDGQAIKPVLNFPDDFDLVKYSSIAFLAIGVTFELLHASVNAVIIDNAEEQGFGGFGNLVSVGYLSIICWIYYQKKFLNYVYVKFDLMLMIIFGLYFLVSMISNTKHQIIMVFISLVVSVLSFNLKFRWSQLFGVLCAGLIFTQIIAPVIHSVRGYEFDIATFDQKIDIVVESIMGSESSHSSDSYTDNNFYDYLPNNGPLIDRLDILLETDVVVSGVNRYGFVGDYPVSDAFFTVLPGFLVKDRSEVRSNDKIMWDINEKDYGIINRVTIGLTASLYSVSGYFLLIALLPTTLFLFVFSLVFLFGYKMQMNIFAVFFFSKYLLYFTESTFEIYANLLLRDMPLTLIMVFLTLKITSVFTKVKIKL
jgi:hypothetical protein